MEMLSKEYGWTPNEIREQPYDDIQNYLDIISIKRQIEKAERMKKQ
jgi:hypothetical protein